jgi:hypothetical protein
MTTKNLPPIEYLRKRLRYDGETGKLFWLDYPTMSAQWRGKLADKEAFTAISHGYRIGRLGGVNYPAHRVIWAITQGCWPAGEIDHINGVRDDNRIENLRDVDRLDQRRNMKRYASNVSGVAGVCFDKTRGLWVAYIQSEYLLKRLGRFRTLEEAAAARKAAERLYGFHDNHGR